MKSKTFVDGIALGIVIAAIFLFLIFALIDINPLDSYFHDYAQTIFIAMATALSAYFAVAQIKHQIASQFEIEEQRRSEALRAERALLPIALSNLSQELRQYLIIMHDKPSLTPPEKILKLSEDDIRTIKRCIQFSDNITGDRLSYMLKTIQIIRARYEKGYFSKAIPEGKIDWGITPYNQVSFSIGCAVLGAVVESASNNARGRQYRIPAKISHENVISFYASARVMIESVPDIQKIIIDRDAKNTLEFDFALHRREYEIITK